MLDLETNAARGLAYLSESYSKAGGDIARTLAGYNGGHGQIDRQQALWPMETKRYVAWGMGIYWDAKMNHEVSNTLTHWLNAGGWHLCQQAEVNLGLR